MIEELETILKTILAIILNFLGINPEIALNLASDLAKILTPIFVSTTFVNYISILALVFRRKTYKEWWNDKGEIDKILLSFGLGILNLIISILFTLIILSDVFLIFIYSPYSYIFDSYFTKIILPLFFISYFIQLVLFISTNENGLKETFFKWGKFLVRRLSLFIIFFGSIFILDVLRYISLSYNFYNSLWLNNIPKNVLLPFLIGILFIAGGLELFIKYR